jgi:hypothetical protein
MRPKITTEVTETTYQPHYTHTKAQQSSTTGAMTMEDGDNITNRYLHLLTTKK